VKTIKISTNKIKLNADNPRIIKDEKFAKLVQSVKGFPSMLEIRPIVVNSDMVVLGGNMRLKACIEAGIKEVSIIIADKLTKEQQQEFIIKDNISGGEWDWDLLKSWDSENLGDWGVEVLQFAPAVDYSILDNEDVEAQLSNMTSGVKKAIQIEFDAEHYEEAYKLVKFWRDQKAYVGAMIIEYLKDQKKKL